MVLSAVGADLDLEFTLGVWDQEFTCGLQAEGITAWQEQCC